MTRNITRRDTLGLLGVSSAAALVGRGLPAERPVSFEPRPSTPVGLDGTRKEFLLPEGFVFMDNGATGACPRRVLEAADTAWRRMEQSPAESAYGEVQREAEAVHERLAGFLGASRREVLPTINTTDAMNAVARGIDLRAGDRVLSTNHEHPGGRYCWEYLAERFGVLLDVAEIPTPPEDPGQVVDRLTAKLTPRTRVISVSHVTFDTGLRLPIEAIAELSRRHGALFVVDGAQVPGGMRVDVQALGCDAYATSAHKWMLGPKGTGALYVRLDSREAIYPARTYDGWFVYSGSMGLQNLPALIGLGEALAFLEELSMVRVEAHNLRLRSVLYERLAELPRLRLMSPPDGQMASPIVSVALPEGVDPQELRARLLEKHRISARAITEEEGFAGLRFTTHVYNDLDDCDRLAAALAEELPG